MSGHRHRLRVIRIAAIGALIASTTGRSDGRRAGARGADGPGRRLGLRERPAPGHPFGIAVGDGRVYVSTSAGDFFADPAQAAT